MEEKHAENPAENLNETQEKYLVIARKWRPGTFADVVGQRHIIRSLQNAVTMNRIAGAYLFSGMRGVGKTSMARILAKSINCVNGPTATPCGECDICREITNGSSLDVVEIDGASNNSVAEVRDLREQLQYAPAKCRKKVYIIDEVHMLSTSAFNAFLKTLEEPPPHVVFVMATTEMTKIPDTVLSRCQCFEFRALSDAQITGRLLEIAEKEGIALTEAGMRMIARRAEGSMRDAQSLLDQISAYADGEIGEETVGMVLGLVSREKIWSLLAAVIDKDVDSSIRQLHDIYYAGYDASVLVKEMFGAVRILTISKAASSPESLLDESADTISTAGKIAQGTSIGRLQLFYEILLRTEGRLKSATNPLSALEMALVKMIRLDDVVPIDEILHRLKSGKFSAAQPSSAAANVSTPVAGKSAPYRPKPPAADTQAGQASTGPASNSTHGRWLEIVAAISEKSRAFGATLEKAAEFSVITDQAVIKYRQKDTMFRDQCEKNRKVLEDEIRKVFNTHLKLTLVPLEDSGEKADRKARDNDIKKEMLADPIIQKAVDMFDGRPGYESNTG